MKKNLKKVFVGMSGGVDSSVSAALLKKAGYEVIGVFIRVWEPSGFVCTWREERREARRAAAHLDIPLITLDLSKEYKKRVVDYFIAEYKAGRTPNPDVMCNKHIKFGVFYDWAMDKMRTRRRPTQNKRGQNQDLGFVATGHYASVVKQKVPEISNSPHRPREGEGSFLLGDAKDVGKDQTYFLWNLHQDQLPHILFPISGYTKPQVRALAKKFGLPNALKKDSQGLCFVGQIDFKDFLKREINEKSGNVLNEQGEVIGRHDGATFFTLGERHGFETFTKTPDEKPYYIIAKDIKKNTLTVSSNPHLVSAEKLEVKIEKTNWIAPLKPVSCFARVRYRQPLQKCHLTQIDTKKGTATVVFEKPQLATPGQSLVLYDKNICLGGGIIR